MNKPDKGLHIHQTLYWMDEGLPTVATTCAYYPELDNATLLNCIAEAQRYLQDLADRVSAR